MYFYNTQSLLAAARFHWVLISILHVHHICRRCSSIFRAVCYYSTWQEFAYDRGAPIGAAYDVLVGQQTSADWSVVETRRFAFRWLCVRSMATKHDTTHTAYKSQLTNQRQLPSSRRGERRSNRLRRCANTRLERRTFTIYHYSRKPCLNTVLMNEIYFGLRPQRD
jgi:hypothetical protein